MFEGQKLIENTSKRPDVTKQANKTTVNTCMCGYYNYSVIRSLKTEYTALVKNKKELSDEVAWILCINVHCTCNLYLNHKTKNNRNQDITPFAIVLNPIRVQRKPINNLRGCNLSKL